MDAFLRRVMEIREAEQLAARMMVRGERAEERPACIGGCGRRTASPDRLCSVCSKRNSEAKIDRERMKRAAAREVACG